MSYRFKRTIGAPDGLFKTKLAPDAPLAPTSTNYVARLNRQRQYSTTSSPVVGPWGEDFVAIFDYSQYSIPIYMMPDNWPTQQVLYKRDDGSTPGGALQAVWMNVPIPNLEDCKPGFYSNSNAVEPNRIPASGTDSSVAIIRGCELWEFHGFLADPASPSGWKAAWGGYHPNIYAAFGTYRDNSWGITASGIVAPCGLITHRDAEIGVIEHALTMTLPCMGQGGSTSLYVSPFTRGDTGNFLLSGTMSDFDADRLPHGVRFRLPADFDIAGYVQDQVAAHPTINSGFFSAVLTAIRDYGMFTADSSGGVVSVRYEDPRTVGTPYSPYATVPNNWMTSGTSRHSLKYIPWASLQQVAVPASSWEVKKIVKVGGSARKLRRY